MVTRLSRPRTLALCALPVLALFGVAAFAPLPFTLAQPGTTANVLGDVRGTPVISVEGTPTRSTSGQLRMTTIIATGPKADVGLGDVIDSWFRTDRAVLPRDSVYPTGGSEKEIEKHNLEDMKKSQNSAVDAALTYLGKPPARWTSPCISPMWAGPAAGLFFALGIVDKLDGNGSGGDLTGGRTIAGTGTIEANGDVGAVGGVSLKTQAAKRDGATVFLVPKAECKEAGAELPKGLKLIPVTTLKSAVSSLQALEQGHKVPSC